MPQILSFYIDETLVQGKVTYCKPYDIMVEITEPFSGFKAASHIPTFARHHKHFKGIKGHHKAIELLIELYTELQNSVEF
ncbi:hypothetical protein NX722_15065 [Endozoicomonas gorgoniicola]|uniref:Uncharacterized protein n=1 Tax=Endozoicomonas gorgoniicola TaxID=1234144 RepID=A0ABT3MXV7_9GAMM|nr:hypothetical protein [Endozoicomonas gorgoniicola]MCW7553918.1 hypothetical protein [Endozoicomonas gorgoniicola]